MCHSFWLNSLQVRLKHVCHSSSVITIYTIEEMTLWTFIDASRHYEPGYV